MIGFVFFAIFLVQSAAFRCTPHWIKPLLPLRATSDDASKLSHTEILRSITSKLASQAEGSGSSNSGSLLSMLTAFIDEYARYLTLIA